MRRYLESRDRAREKSKTSGATSSEPDGEEADDVAPGDGGKAPEFVDDGGAGGAGAMVDGNFCEGDAFFFGDGGDFEPKAFGNFAEVGEKGEDGCAGHEDVSAAGVVKRGGE